MCMELKSKCMNMYAILTMFYCSVLEKPLAYFVLIWYTLTAKNGILPSGPTNKM